MRDISWNGKWGNHNQRHAHTKSQCVDLWGLNVVVKAAPVVPGNENGRIIPILAVHNRIYIISHKILRRFHEGWWVIREITRGCDIGDTCQITTTYIRRKLGDIFDHVWRVTE